MVFDLTGASASHAWSGDPAGNVIVPLVLLAFVAASWALRPESRRLAGLPSAYRAFAPQTTAAAH